jgi:hypothetical protein
MVSIFVASMLLILAFAGANGVPPFPGVKDANIYTLLGDLVLALVIGFVVTVATVALHQRKGFRNSMRRVSVHFADFFLTPLSLKWRERKSSRHPNLN